MKLPDGSVGGFRREYDEVVVGDVAAVSEFVTDAVRALAQLGKDTKSEFSNVVLSSVRTESLYS